MNVPLEVVEAVSEGRCLLFVGSRATTEAQEDVGVTVPSEKKLARQLSGRRMTFREACEVAEQAQGRPALMETIRGIRSGADAQPTSFHSLALRRFPRIFTTCYDDLLERAAVQMGGRADVFYRGQQIPPADPARRSVIKLWGGFERPDTVLLTPRDFRGQPYDANFRKQLRLLLRNHVIFFVGYRADETEFDHLWDDLTQAYGGELPRCHLAVAQGRLTDANWQKWVWRGLLPFIADPSEALGEIEKQLS